jgi:hypothetical protein
MAEQLGLVSVISEYPEGIPAPICDKFERLALDVASMGYKRYSADSVLHRLRWHYHIEKGDRGFKCNNNWTAPLARWFLKRHPELPKFFELRERTGPAEQWIDA